MTIFFICRLYRCLVEGAGDVAFVKHTTIDDVMMQGDDWSLGVRKGDYKLLCKDGSTRPVDDWEMCNLAQVCLRGV